MSFQTTFQQFIDQEQLYRTEGRQGTETLCIIAKALGYHDPQRFGYVSNKVCIGDLIMFIEDNPGVVEAITTWISQQRSPEWEENIKDALHDEHC